LGTVLRNIEIEGGLTIQRLPIPLERRDHGVPIGGPGIRIEGAAKKGPAIQQQALGVVEALLQAWILLLGDLPLPLKSLEPLFQLHQPLGKEMERASQILGTTADPE
jgi:hypothetical protein